MMEKKSDILNLAFLCTGILFITMGFVRAETIYFGTSADQAPYNSLDHNGRVQGFEADLKDLLCTRAELTCDWVLAPRDALAQQLETQEFDVIMSGLKITDSGGNNIAFSAPYLTNMPSAILVLSANGVPLAGQHVGAIDGSTQSNLVTSMGWSLDKFGRSSAALTALNSGEISGFAADQAFLQNIVSNHPEKYEIAANGISTPGNIGFGVRPSDTGLLARLNSAMSSLKADGSLDNLAATWFSTGSTSTQTGG